MAAKLMEVLEILRDRGWKCHVFGDLQGWGIYINYIDEGPEFGLLVRLDPICWSPYVSAEDLANIVQQEGRDAIQYAQDRHPDRYDAWRC